VSLGNKPLITSVDKLDFNTTANVEGLWFINKNLNLAYFSAFTSDSIPSNTSTNIGSNPWSAMNALTSLHASIKSSFMVHKKFKDACKAFFEAPVKRKGGQKPILFERIESEPIACENSRGGSESPQFFHYGQKPHHMMKTNGE